jgi:guanylate kinase
MTSSARGKLFVISAPSGAGKSTLANALLAAEPELRFSISYTTRAPRVGEQNGREYFFVDRPRFEAMIADGELLEHAEVFGNFYGTGRAQIEEHRVAGRNVLLDIDWQGARQVRSHMADCVLIFVMPPSLQELERRLRARGTDRDEVIRRRLAEAVSEMSHWNEYDYVVINDDVNAALTALRSIIAGQNTDNRTTNAGLRARINEIVGAVHI